MQVTTFCGSYFIPEFQDRTAGKRPHCRLQPRSRLRLLLAQSSRDPCATKPATVHTLARVTFSILRSQPALLSGIDLGLPAKGFVG